MKTLVSVSLNGVNLYDVSPYIVIQSVDESAPVWAVNAGANGSNIGQHLNSFEQRYKDISISYAISVTKDMALRASVYNAVAKWAANGGKLSVSYRTGLELDVVCATLPAMGYAFDWTKPQKITFRALYPFWTLKTPNTLHNSGNITAEGNAPSPLAFKITNTGTAALNAVTITSADQTIYLRNMALAADASFEMSHVRGLQTWTRTDTGTCLDKRSESSVDDIILPLGTNAVTVTADGDCDVLLSSFGRWF